MTRMLKTNHKKHTLLITILVLVIINPISASEYYIKNASDLNQISLKPGDVVIMKNGIWRDEQLQFSGKGKKKEPITLKAETGGKVVLTGSSALRISGVYLVIDGLLFKDGHLSSGDVIEFRTGSDELAYNCRLTKTKIINYNPADKDTEYKWVSIYGKNNRVDHCHFEGKTHNGTLLVIWLDNNPNYNRIDHNYFGRRPELGYNGGEIIRIGDSDHSMYDSYSIVEYNLFEDCQGEIEILSNKSCRNIYRNNTFRNCFGALTLRHGNDCEIYNNFFFGADNNKGGGIRIFGENHKVYNNYLQDISGDGYRAAISLSNGILNSPPNGYHQVINAQVVNNTIVNSRHPIVIGADRSEKITEPPKDCYISNNVIAVYTPFKEKQVEYEDEPINLTYQANIIYGDKLGIPEQKGIKIQDPELIEGDIWRPSESSPVIGYGVRDFSYITFDIDYHVRGNDIDAGCDQLGNGPPTNYPLIKEDVGVKW